MFFFCYLFLLVPVYGFIAYDCGGSGSNYTSVSLVSVAPCDYETRFVEEKEVTIQLLQPRTKIGVWAKACKIEIDYIVFHCGMYSHSSIVKGGHVSKVMTVGKDYCHQLHRDKSGVIYGNLVHGMVINETTAFPATFAGSVGGDGHCESSEFIDGDRNWGKVAATGTIRVSLYEFAATVHLERREIRFPSGTVCSLDADRCLDNDHGPVFWSEFLTSDCDRENFNVLYQGLARRAAVRTGKDSDRITHVYSVTDERNLFTLSSTGAQLFCLLKLVKTEHPKVFIHEVTDGNFFFRQSSVNPLDMDMFMYVNTKFSHLDHTLSGTMNAMYEEIVRHRCELERKVLMTELSLASVSPLEFAYEHMRGPGYTASLMGEAVYVIQCQPVDVTATHVIECTTEMPVLYKNVTYYMRPRNRILQSVGTPTQCDGLLHPMYHINGDWYASSNTLQHARAPRVLSADSSGTWTYTSAGNLATAGIYTYDQLDRLREQIMAPIERRTKGERFSGLLNSERLEVRGLNLESLKIESIVREHFNTFWERAWGWTSSVGNFASGIIGIAFIFKLIKFTIDTFIHAVSLREVYGCTWYVFGSIWDALTTYLLTRRVGGTSQGGEKSDRNESEVEMRCIQVVGQREEPPGRTCIYPPLIREGAPIV